MPTVVLDSRRRAVVDALAVLLVAAGGRLALAGTLEGRPLHLALRRLDERQFPLLRREIRWVTEQAFDR